MPWAAEDPLPAAKTGPTTEWRRHKSGTCASAPLGTPYGSGSVRNLVRGAGFASGSDKAFSEHDGELGLCLGPFARRDFPFPSELAQDQEDEFRRRLIVGEM